jgi:hypothetical protein
MTDTSTASATHHTYEIDGRPIAVTYGTREPATALKRPRRAHIWAREEYWHYVENRWVSRALFREERFDSAVHDPACGFGNVVVAARAAGLEASAADIVNRGFQGTQVRDFLQDGRRYPNVICNPPFEIIARFGPHAVAASLDRTALLFPSARLHAAGKGWLRGLSLSHVWLLSPRPSLPPGEVYRRYREQGREPSGGRVDFAWLIFKRGYRGPVTLDWLQRDRQTSDLPMEDGPALDRQSAV